MVGLLIAIRNFTIALVLAWMGFSIAPDDGEKQEPKSDPQGSATLTLIAG